MHIAIAGNIGSGKTTLGDLIMGLYTPEKGSITLDGLDIKEYPSYWNAGPTAGNIIRLIAPILNVEYDEKKEVELLSEKKFNSSSEMKYY